MVSSKKHETNDEKAVGIASLLGSMADIENNNLYITCNQATTVLNDTPDADAKDRNIFGLAYESAARKSAEAVTRPPLPETVKCRPMIFYSQCKKYLQKTKNDVKYIFEGTLPLLYQK